MRRGTRREGWWYVQAEPAEVVQRLQRGDQDAVSELYARYGRSVWAVAHRVLQRRDLADDATQQTFVQLWRHAASLDPARPVGPWLHTVARRCAIGLLRKEHPEREVSLDAPAARALASDDTDAMARSWEVWQVRRAVDALPPEERDTLQLTHFEERTHAEAAELLGVPVGTVKSRSARAYRRLAGALTHLHDDSDEPMSPWGRADDARAGGAPHAPHAEGKRGTP